MRPAPLRSELKTANPFDKAFDAANIAEQKAGHAEIERLASSIVDSQQKEIDQMKAWRAAWYPGP